jgi:hypothetical protein
MPPAGLELAFEARGRPQNHALDSVATVIGTSGLAEGKIHSDLVYSKSEDTFQKYLISL